MDLFYQGTLQEQIKALKKDIRVEAKKQGVAFKHKLALVWGIPAYQGNNILLVQPPYKEGKYFQDKSTERLKNTLNDYEITKYFITYSYHIPKDKVTRKDIKTYGSWIAKIVNAVAPRLVVCLGEDAIFSFFKRKMILRDNHGEIVGRHESIPIMLTYPFDYYTQKSEYEDSSYKNFLLDSDWKSIKNEYDKRIKNENI